ncbi:cellulose biosynthesis cyclic di-GMP-binding regulatory protein BcsB [Klebsiella pneumoniae]|nr:cellulose biosynthesis cyclic di-GMP-binding regulatory protein BcsB [Klebsiella pneumoniae]
MVGKNDTALRMAAWRLTRGNFAPQTATLDVEPQTIPVGKAYDAPRWITHRSSGQAQRAAA